MKPEIGCKKLRYAPGGCFAAEINSKHQHPSSRETSSVQAPNRTRRAHFEVWSFSGAWRLVLGSFILLRRRIVEAFAVDVVRGDERAGEAGDFDGGKIHVRHVRDGNRARARARNVGEREAVNGPRLRNIGSRHQFGDLLHADIFEAKVMHARPFFHVARNGVGGLNAFFHQVNADERWRFQHREVLAGNVFHEPAAAVAALDEDGVLPPGDDAVLKLHVADAAGYFGAQAERGVNGALQPAVADDDVLRRTREVLRGETTARLERDRVVAGVDVATLEQHAVAGVHVEAVTIGVHRADGQVAGGEVFAEQHVDGPELLVLRGEIFQHRVGAAG